jgi:GR25 family glycosyltransferase involved in LPS biosynthesis
MKTYQREGPSDIGQFREIENKTSNGVFYGDLTKKYDMNKIKFLNTDNNEKSSKYRILVGDTIYDNNSINLYNQLKNVYNIIEVNNFIKNSDYVYILFNYHKNIEDSIKYILVNEQIDENKIANSKYCIVNSIDMVNKYIDNYSIYKKLLLNDSDKHLNNLLLTFKLGENKIDLDDKKINVLTLSTSITRLNNFVNANNNLMNKFNIIEGIKYNPGFIGCGLSYKMIISIASRLNLDFVKICEDDCKINNYEIIDKAIEYLTSNNLDWELLSCFIVDINDNLEIYEQVDLDEKYKLLKINQWTSMVCNIYSKSSYKYFETYLKNNLNKNLNKNDVLSNTIDRSLQFKDIWLIYPFPIELIDSKSEIWFDPKNNGNNTNEYKNIMKKSCKIIENTKLKYEKYNYQQILNNEFEILKFNNIFEPNIIISLTTIPPRFISETFKKVIDKIFNQLLKPKYIIISLCNKYKREFNYDLDEYENTKKYFIEKYNNVIINYSNDYGPGTKLMGLIHTELKLNDEDKIIIIDDDWYFSDKMTLIYELCYQLYNSDCIFIDERNNIIWDPNYFSYMNLIKPYDIFYNNYQNFVYGWLSFSFKYKCLKNILEFYNEINRLDENLWKHDDLIFTIFYKINKFNASGINMLLFESNERTDLDDFNALRSENNSWLFRHKLEQKVFEKYNFKLSLLNKHNYVINNIDNYSEFKIQNKISKRDLLYNISNIDYEPTKNVCDNNHVDFKYINKNLLMITITFFNNITYDYIKFKIGDKKYNIKLNPNNFSSRQTFFINITDNLIINKHNNFNFNIIQTNKNNLISLNKFNSILTILCNIPHLNYVFYTDNEIDKFILNNFEKIYYIYQKLNPGAYKADFFRILYIYTYGGIYFDCKMILYQNIDNLLLLDMFFVKDITINYVYNAFFFIANKKNNLIECYIKNILLNIINENYSNNSLGITGPGLMGKIILNNLYFYNSMIDDNWKNCVIKLDNDVIYLKNSYNNYYEENDYLEINHYSVLWNNKKVFLNIDKFIKYDKINYIDHIVWINLDRSIIRKNNMEKIFKQIDIKNSRISAVDGKNINVSKLINIKTELTNYEIACTLSHLKAIFYLSKLEGEYFMVCEDDINFNYINLFDETLKDIILNSPNFDILLINKTYNNKIESDYVSWNSEFKKGPDYHIAGTVCYIISKNGIKNILDQFDYINNIYFFKNNYFDVADKFLYKNVNTIVYKYNFINTDCIDSDIHSNHIEWHKITRDYQLNEILNKVV